MKTLLHVGCGTADIRHLPPYFNDGGWSELRYDVDASVQPDLVGTLQDMSLIGDESIDAIYSSHNIEHVWHFEVAGVLAEFLRVLKPTGFAVVLCPDIFSVAEAITRGYLTEPLYISPAGPISAIDILYGFQKEIATGNLFMAHKTAFTAHALGSQLTAAGFAGALVARDQVFGLHALVTKEVWAGAAFNDLKAAIQPVAEDLVESLRFGVYSGVS